MDQPQVDPKGKGVGSIESNYPDEHGYEEMVASAFAGRMRRDQDQISSSGLATLLLLIPPIPACWDYQSYLIRTARLLRLLKCEKSCDLNWHF